MAVTAQGRAVVPVAALAMEGGCKDDSCAFVKNSFPFGTDKVPGFDDRCKKAWTDIKKAPIGQALGKITLSRKLCPVQGVELFGKSVMFGAARRELRLSRS
ncbi:hypothetical protein [Pseudomonas aeruginosa]|uniref:hypothetical protein n=1 Tax=Pseudomonas aeruginosa TaxID=287 RepID=UPI0021B2211C|nr:hypothetical protein [Pseudomonas aeruginosa]MCT7418575.1 hypothetical protein [Pseudomonas aeruginosa]